LKLFTRFSAGVMKPSVFKVVAWALKLFGVANF
jgi:hypothetical protein